MPQGSRPVGEHFDKGLIRCDERDPEVAILSQANSIRKARQTINHHLHLPPLHSIDCEPPTVSLACLSTYDPLNPSLAHSSR